jgi:hypothetical protein
MTKEDRFCIMYFTFTHNRFKRTIHWAQSDGETSQCLLLVKRELNYFPQFCYLGSVRENLD